MAAFDGYTKKAKPLLFFLLSLLNHTRSFLPIAFTLSHTLAHAGRALCVSPLCVCNCHCGKCITQCTGSITFLSLVFSLIRIRCTRLPRPSTGVAEGPPAQMADCREPQSMRFNSTFLFRNYNFIQSNYTFAAETEALSCLNATETLKRSPHTVIDSIFSARANTSDSCVSFPLANYKQWTRFSRSPKCSSAYLAFGERVAR